MLNFAVILYIRGERRGRNMLAKVFLRNHSKERYSIVFSTFATIVFLEEDRNLETFMSKSPQHKREEKND